MEKGAHAIVCVRSYDNLYDSVLSPCESGGVWAQGIHQAWKQALFPAKPRHQPVSCFHSPFWNQALDPSGSGFPNVNCSIEQASSFYEPPPGLSRLVQFLAHLFQILIPLDPVWLKLIKLTFAKFQWLSCCWRSRFINSGGKDFRIFPCKIFHLNLLTHKLWEWVQHKRWDCDLYRLETRSVIEKNLQGKKIPAASLENKMAILIKWNYIYSHGLSPQRFALGS